MLVQKEVLLRLSDFFIEPFTSKDMFWILIPLVFSLIIMEIYYIKYKNEELGWNTATANSFIIIFIGMDLLRYLSNHSLLIFWPGKNGFSLTMLVTIVLIEGLLMFGLNFGHKWPKFIAYHLSSRLTVNMIAYISIIIVYRTLPLTLSTFVAGILFFILITIIFLFIKLIYNLKNKNNGISNYTP